VFFYEYAMSRYKEMDDLISRARQSGQSLLTWQTALFVGTTGILARGGLLRFWVQDFVVAMLSCLGVASLLAAIVMSARAAFWTETVSIPASPKDLFGDLCGAGIKKRDLCEHIADVYEHSKVFVGRISGRLRLSLVLAGISIGLLVTLLFLLSISQPAIVEKMFSGK